MDDEDDEMWGNAPDDFSVSVYNSAANFGSKKKHVIPISRVQVGAGGGGNYNKTGRMLLKSKASGGAALFSTQPFSTSIVEIAEEDEDADFPAFPPPTAIIKGEAKRGQLAAAERFHSSFGNLNENHSRDRDFDFEEDLFEETLPPDDDVKRESRRDRKDSSTKRRGRSKGRLEEDKAAASSTTRSRSRSKGALDREGSKSTSGTRERSRSRSRGPLDDKSDRRTTRSRSRSSGPPDAKTGTDSSNARRRIRSRSRDKSSDDGSHDRGATEQKTLRRAKSPGALSRRGKSPGRLNTATSSATRSKSPGALTRRSSMTGSQRQERSIIRPPRRVKSLDMDAALVGHVNSDEEEHDEEVTRLTDLVKKQKQSLDEGLKLADADPSSSRRARKRSDEKSMSSRSSGGRTTDDDAAESSTPSSSRLKGSTEVNMNSLDDALKLVKDAPASASSRRGRRDSRSITSDATGTSRRSVGSKSSASSTDDNHGNTNKEHRRRERVRSARDRLKEEEAKVKRLQEEAKALEEKRQQEEAKLEALREEARILQKNKVSGEPKKTVDVKEPRSRAGISATVVPKRYQSAAVADNKAAGGASKEETRSRDGITKTTIPTRNNKSVQERMAKFNPPSSGDVSQLPPAFQMLAKAKAGSKYS